MLPKSIARQIEYYYNRDNEMQQIEMVQSIERRNVNDWVSKCRNTEVQGRRPRKRPKKT